jgi:hypothetical protein
MSSLTSSERALARIQARLRVCAREEMAGQFRDGGQGMTDDNEADEP